MAIRDWNAYRASHWDWGIFNGCFPGKVGLSDLDGALECNGYLLIIETKTPGADLSGGQRIAFSHWVRTRIISVLVVWGHPQQPQEAQIYHLGHVRDRQPCDLAMLRYMVAMWYVWAARQPPAWTLTQQPNE